MHFSLHIFEYLFFNTMAGRIKNEPTLRERENIPYDKTIPTGIDMLFDHKYYWQLLIASYVIYGCLWVCVMLEIWPIQILTWELKEVFCWFFELILFWHSTLRLFDIYWDYILRAKRDMVYQIQRESALFSVWTLLF